MGAIRDALTSPKTNTVEPNDSPGKGIALVVVFAACILAIAVWSRVTGPDSPSRAELKIECEQRGGLWDWNGSRSFREGGFCREGEG
jgi:hypothetical protein